MNGRVLADRYEIVRHIGSGGMASVHEAIDHHLDRRVAVKLMLPQFGSDERFLERFRREARAAAALNHPNIVTVHDTGDDLGTPFIVMEYVDGTPLEESLDGIDPARALDVVAEVAAALAYAHRHGVVHRDVKPANILLTEHGSVKVSDFGIARAAGTDTITVTSVLGTAAYLSPEQARGDDVDGRSDIYALGVVLYELLTGEPPFEGGSPVQVALRHVAESPTRPSEIAPVDPPLEAIVLTALAKHPTDRYDDATAFREDLLAYRDGRPVGVDLDDAIAASSGIGDADEPTERIHPVTADADRETAALEPLEPTAAVPTVGRRPASETVRVERGDAGPQPERPRRADRDRQRLVPWFALGVVVALALAVLTVIDGDQTTVPQVKGMQRDEAVAAIRDAGLVVAEVHERPHGSIPAGEVLASRPFGGETVREGAGVVIAVSTGPD